MLELDDLAAGEAGSTIADTIRTMIFSGQLRDGEVIRQEALAAELGASRLTIRAALGELANEGLIRLPPHRSASVASLSQAELAERIGLRLWVEPQLIKLAIENSTEQDVKKIAAILDEYSGFPRPEWWKWAEINCRFHIAMYAPSGHTHAVGLCERWMKETARYRTAMFHNGSPHGEHEELLQQFRDRNPSKGATLLKRHILRWRAQCLSTNHQ